MKPDRSMTRTLGLLALCLFGALASPEAQADSMLPRYRLEDLGLASKYDHNIQNPNLLWLSDGTVYAGGMPLDSTDKLYRKGEYLRSISYKNPPDEYVMKKDGSDVNLLAGIDPKTASFDTFSSSGKALFTKVGSQFVFETSTGQMTNFPTVVGNDTYSLLGINGLDEMVGTGWIGGERKAIYYASINSEAMLLSSLVDNPGQWLLQAGTDINDTGEIVGYGYDLSQPTYDGPHVFKLVPVAPVPEPSTWLVLGLGSLWIFRKFRPSAI
ncbi:PEP-CTERM sorting domain-containing protein [bacterium]|nr:PEP-CTERM sorting domain-containing protein [bacterium]